MTTAIHEVSENTMRGESTTTGVEVMPIGPGPVVFATMGEQGMMGLARMAELLAGRLGRGVKVVSVVSPIPLYTMPREIEARSAAIDQQALEDRQQHIDEKAHEAFGNRVAWTSEVCLGTPAHEIARVADREHAAVLLVGAGPHRRMRQIISGQRATQILHRTSAPVLSMAPGQYHLPGRIVAAIDFNPASIRAAHAAMMLAADDARLLLLHIIEPYSLLLPQYAPSRTDLEIEAHRRLESVREFLHGHARHVVIECRALHGDAVERTLAQAEELNADLITAGTMGVGSLRRLFVGSVASEILHAAPCGVLVAHPPSAADASILRLATEGSEESLDSKAWRTQLDAFSKRNAGRRATLEVDDPAFGAQLQARGYLFQAVTYDEADRRVVLMLNAEGPDAAHLTRNIPGISAIGFRMERGRDVALELRHGNGHTLLLLQS